MENIGGILTHINRLGGSPASKLCLVASHHVFLPNSLGIKTGEKSEIESLYIIILSHFSCSFFFWPFKMPRSQDVFFFFWFDVYLTCQWGESIRRRRMINEKKKI